MPSLEDGTLNATPLMQTLPAPTGEARAKEIDRAWFSENPDALSYVRAYVPGEVHPLLLLSFSRGREPEAVAVAMACPDVFARVMLWPGMLHASGRVWAEKAARKERARLKRRGRSTGKR
ncbi:hypothetical protein [Deinococcus sp. ME38]|uniref:hypothetical protein n=1 Tax=Deinococcus sp. ME38 TaxID=3400344 RepID=UPI003B5A1AA0